VASDGHVAGASRSFVATFRYDARDGRDSASRVLRRKYAYPADASGLDDEIARLGAEKAEADKKATEARRQMQNVPSLERRIRAQLGRHALANSGDTGQAILAAIELQAGVDDPIRALIAPSKS
jgi:hypothetical protein